MSWDIIEQIIINAGPTTQRYMINVTQQLQITFSLTLKEDPNNQPSLTRFYNLQLQAKLTQYDGVYVFDELSSRLVIVLK